MAVAFDLDSQASIKGKPATYFKRVREQLEPLDELSQDQYGFIVARFLLNHMEKPSKRKSRARAARSKSSAPSAATP